MPRGERPTIHEGLVGARELIGTRYLADPALRAEYAREIAPRTEAALARVLGEVYGSVAGAGHDDDKPAAGGRPTLPPPGRAIDLGAGTGAVRRVLHGWFGAGLEIVAVDVVAAPGVRRADLSKEIPAVEGRFDLLVAAHLLNELYVGRPASERARLRAERVLAWSEALLAPDGALVLIEPALRETSRELLEVRDRLAAAGLFVLAPCLRQERCPALARERDWCHDAAPVAGRSRVDFSYLVLRPGAAGGPATLFEEPDVYRIVSDPLVEKGRRRLFGCGAAGRHELVRLNRDASTANAAFDGAVRGDVIRVSGATSTGDERVRLSSETVVTHR